MQLLRSIPALPVKTVAQSTPFYRDILGFTLIYEESGFAVLKRDDVEIHLWQAGDEAWRARSAGPPIVSGAESFIAGTASCRVEVQGVDALHRALKPLQIIHPNAQIADHPWGSREFGVVDPDNNLITFFERR